MRPNVTSAAFTHYQHLSAVPGAGFSLHELMVVVCIIAVLSAMALPNFIRWQQASELNAAAADIVSLLQNARLRAVKENARVVVLFDPDGDGRLEGNFLAFVDDMRSRRSQWTHEPATESAVARGRIPAGISISRTQFSGHRLRFNSRGQLMNGNRSIFLRNARNQERQIQLYVSGHCRILRRAASR
jgi:prepilin-type N-terminal cleavage/methylation domain-containing protein